ncbi:YggS family pyridoxal phosphate-dependent enzyme [Croceimicrobium hydrocarbonivorans]|uniref:Pyridoxal phosphate homeostasis protein n=1 Tax=Croceimicrobium hydrocarbonivorans TaxID=2761580 RepID=A0A7H0VGX0_9FLAO|nr:YggS family pyridoxal phosphate-dependent enzyme [Croceimicrobium hydrocarbonivorans]QNR24968.1 YggS family pyridoxal phosphate-dependent enzyme [Croceimicrobium hydrocarbonivorans]
MSIAENLVQIKAGLAADVQLVAVSKTKPNSAIQEAYEAGQRVFGENRIQEMSDKAEALPKDIEWHMIGHVQDNKIKYMAPFVSMVHGMDKEKRIKTLNKEASKVDRRIDCLVQIHIAEEDSKFGFDYDEAKALFSKDLESLYPNVRICGLMGMATFTDNEDQVRKEFRGLSQFFHQLKQELFEKDYFKVLSMGMSGDYKIAMEEGSTMVRIGSSIFGARN